MKHRSIRGEKSRKSIWREEGRMRKKWREAKAKDVKNPGGRKGGGKVAMETMGKAPNVPSLSLFFIILFCQICPPSK